MVSIFKNRISLSSVIRNLSQSIQPSPKLNAVLNENVYMIKIAKRKMNRKETCATYVKSIRTWRYI